MRLLPAVRDRYRALVALAGKAGPAAGEMAVLHKDAANITAPE